MDKFGDDEVGLILRRVAGKADREACSQVCRQWGRVERSTRLSLKVLDGQLLHLFLPRYSNLLVLEVGRGIGNSELQLIADTCISLQVLNLNVTIAHPLEAAGSDTVTDEGICFIAQGCRDLRRVYLGRRNGVGDVGVTALVKLCSKLAYLDLSCCHRVTDQALRAMGSDSSKSLQVVKLHGCTSVTDLGLLHLAMGPSANTLKWLDLRKCNQITDFGVSNLIHLSCLQVLNLAECGPQVTDTGIKAICSVLSSLASLNLSWLPSITDQLLIDIAAGCYNLKKIDVSGCELITGFSVRLFARHKSLQVLILAPCENVRRNDIERTVLGCSTLVNLRLDKRLRLPNIPVGLPKSIRDRCHILWS